MPETPSDQDLITGCLNGQKESWDIFVKKFSKLIYWSIQKTLETSSLKARTELVGEIYQECFTRLIERQELETLRNIDSVRKFLTVMASHMAMDKIRSIGRSEKRTDGDPFMINAVGVTEKDPAMSVISDEQAILVSKALDELTPKQRMCVEWHYLEDKTHREISEVLGMPVDTVSAIIRRGRDRVKQFLLENDK